MHEAIERDVTQAGRVLQALADTLSAIMSRISTFVGRSLHTGADPGQSQGGVEWSSEVVPFLHNITSTTATFRFSYTTGGIYGNLAIDDCLVN